MTVAEKFRQTARGVNSATRALCRLLVCLLVIAIPPAHAGDEGAGFAQLAAQALANDARKPAAEYTLLASEQNIAISAARLLPQLTLLPRYSYSQQRIRTFVSRNRRAEYALRLNMNVMDLSLINDWRAAQDDHAAQRHTRDDTIQQIQMDVITARLQLHIAEEERALLGKQLAGISEQLRLARAREARGVGARLDVLITEAELESIKSRRAAVEARVAQQREALFRLTGQTVTDLPDLAAGFAFPPLAAREEFTSEVMQNNLVLKNALKTLDARIRREKSAARQDVPKLSISGEYQGYETGQDNSEIAVLLTMPLYSGGGLLAAARAATAERLAYAESIRDYRAQLRENIVNLYHQAQSIRRREAFLQREIERRRATLEKNKLAWKEGIGSARLVLDAEQELSAGERNISSLYFEYLSVMAQLNRLNAGITPAFLAQLDGYFTNEND